MHRKRGLRRDSGRREPGVERAAFLSAVEDGMRAAAAGDVHGDDKAAALLDDFGKSRREAVAKRLERSRCK